MLTQNAESEYYSQGLRTQVWCVVQIVYSGSAHADVYAHIMVLHMIQLSRSADLDLDGNPMKPAPLPAALQSSPCSASVLMFPKRKTLINPVINPL